jgi:hypothetical protein
MRGRSLASRAFVYLACCAEWRSGVLGRESNLLVHSGRHASTDKEPVAPPLCQIAAQVEAGSMPHDSCFNFGWQWLVAARGCHLLGIVAQCRSGLQNSADAGCCGAGVRANENWELTQMLTKRSGQQCSPPMHAPG